MNELNFSRMTDGADEFGYGRLGQEAGGVFESAYASGNFALNSSESRLVDIGWREIRETVPWPPRDSHALIVFDGRMWILGGYTCDAFCDQYGCICLNSRVLNDIWSSDDGVHWSEVLGNAPFPPRAGHAVLEFANKLWILGGSDSPEYWVKEQRCLSDVWSSVDGISWEQVTEAAPWAPRAFHAAAVFGGRIWVLGGQNAGGMLNDVWSTEDGVNWARATGSAEWGPSAGHTATVFDDKIWLLGGSRGERDFSNAVWQSVDGMTWSEVTPAAPWQARAYHTALVYDAALWVIAGRSYWPGYLRQNCWDIWCSSDGKHWTEVVSRAPWMSRSRHATSVFNKAIWLVGGRATSIYYSGGTLPRSDVWRTVRGPFHSADKDRDGALNLSEILRVIQFFQAGAYHCSLFGEDGYDIGPGPPYPWDEPEVCVPHDSDYNPQDWRIDLSELLRAVQFFNAGGYHACPGEGTEDGFCPGT